MSINVAFTVRVGPLLCFATIRYAKPLSSSFSLYTHGLYRNITRSASCSIAPLSRKSDKTGLLSVLDSTALES